MDENCAEDRDTDVVVGVDGSPSARIALRWAAAQAERTGGRVRAVTAWEMPVYVAWMPMIPFDEFPAAAAKMLSESVSEVVERYPAVEVVQSVVTGHPAQVLIEESAHAALLVVGSRGRGAVKGAVLGSVSRYCVQHARCPVVVVPGRVLAG